MTTRLALRFIPVLGTLALTLTHAPASDAAAGALAQLTGQAACVSEDGTGGDCADGIGLAGAVGVAVSPDGRHVYVAASGDSIAAFARDRITGALVQLTGTAACVSATGSGGACGVGRGLDAPTAVSISPDGRHVYGASYFSSAVAAFARDRVTGALTQLPGLAGCVSEDGTGGDCANGFALDGAVGVTVSPDGRHVYVAALESSAVVVFARDRFTGALTQLSCVSEDGTGGFCWDGVGLDGAYSLAVSRDGKHLYVVSRYAGAVAAFARDATTGALSQLPGLAACVSEDGSGGLCADGVGLGGPVSVAISSDGTHVYVASFDSGAVAAFVRDRITGALTQLAGTAACVSEDGSGGACTVGVQLDAPLSVSVSGDGRSVYVADGFSGAVAVFGRNRTTGALTQLTGLEACVSYDGSGGDCTDGVGIVTPTGVTVSRDGRSVYVTNADSDAVAAFRRQR
jgi:DNA-binding beta-propeller fold protein YncE